MLPNSDQSNLLRFECCQSDSDYYHIAIKVKKMGPEGKFSEHYGLKRLIYHI